MKPEDNKGIGDWDKLFVDETEEKKPESKVSNRSSNSNDWDDIFSDDNTAISEKKPEEQKYHSSNYTHQPQQTNNSDAAKWGWGIGGVVLFLIVLFAFIIPGTSNTNTGSSSGGSSSNYSLTGSSLKEGYGGSWNYTGRLSNTTNQTHEYRVSVYIYDSGGRVLASKSEYYILAGGGSGTISIFLFPGNTWATYEVLVTGIKKT